MIPLIVFAKAPIPGLAKTRIAAAYGTEIADRIYRELLAATAKSVSGFPYHVAFTEDVSPGELVQIFPDAQSFFPQVSGTLGERMHNAFIRMYKQNNRAAIAIGCDCPYLAEQHFRQAIHYLQNDAEVVIAPAMDGGYTLIGCRPQALPVFLAQGWGKPELFHETLEIIQNHKLHLKLLPELTDIDTFKDYLQWHKQDHK